jgi:PAS domain S-box-containing protein
MRFYLLAVLSVLTAIPALWLGTGYASRIAENDRRGHDQSLVNLSQVVGRQLDTMLEDRCRNLEILAGNVEVLGKLEGPEVERLIVEHWERSRYYSGIYVADAHANALVGAPPRKDGRGAPARRNYADRDYYQELVRTGRTAISKVQRGRLLNATNVQIATPIHGPDRAFIGYAEGSVELASFAELVHDWAGRVPGSRIVVLDGASQVVADSQADARAEAGKLASAPVFLLPLTKSTLASANDETGVLVRAALEPAGAALPGWRIVALRSQQGIDENARRARNQTWATAAMLWLVVFVFAVVVATRFGRRLSELADTVSAIGQGDFERRAAPSSRFEPREFGVLVTQIGAMAERLSHQTRELEATVDVRTAELEQVNERLTILVNALERADDGIEITGPDARFMYVNPAFQKITGYDASELIGRTPAMLRSSAHDTAFYEAIWQRVSSGLVYSGTLVGRRKDGSLFDQELTVWPILDPAGAITHYVGLRRDVTERKRTEQTLRVSERMASLGTLAAGVAHEINNPLTYVLLNLRFLHDRIAGESLGDAPRENRMLIAADRALEGAERVSAIVKDLRALSRPDDRELELVDPRAVLASALRMVGNDLRHRAELVELFEPVPKVMANTAQLGQVFLNLLVNAVQALEGSAQKPGRVRVRTATDEDGFALVEVSDSGCGIRPDHLQRIFDPFFTTKPVGLGTGLGLAHCHSAVKALKGEILVESTVGVGSRFRVRLPPAARAELERPTPVSGAAARRVLAPERVLVLDDDLAVGEALRQALADHDVTVVGSAEAGLAAARTNRYTVIFCDVMMPGMTGMDFYTELARHDPSQLGAVVFMTGGVQSAAVRQFLDRVAAPCLEKPLHVEELEAVVAKLAERRYSALDSVPLRVATGPHSAS